MDNETDMVFVTSTPSSAWVKLFQLRDNFVSVISKTFVLLLVELIFYVKKVQILKELCCLDAEIGIF